MQFQFTPLREGRPERGKRNERVCNFNSRPSARGDVHPTFDGGRFQFQFTPLREGRLTTVAALGPGLIFQFTPLREGRHACAAAFRRAEYFNSRPSARGDPLSMPSPSVTASFQFTPLREGRRDCWWETRTGNISIHAPPRGATGNLARSITADIISIHAPPRGATEAIDAIVEAHSISIHAPPRGAT